MELVQSHKIAFHEKKLGQLFCNNTSQDIINRLLTECKNSDVTLQLKTNIHTVKASKIAFKVNTKVGNSHKIIKCKSLVITTDGLSIPKIGDSKLGYEIAKQFGLGVTALKPALAPLTFHSNFQSRYYALPGVSVDAEILIGKTTSEKGYYLTIKT